ncbi:MAG TPA: DUF1853 family protein [Paraburkholderia sp.]|nr:DUF1853 family protein [Paraburkholderia sp.]
MAAGPSLPALLDDLRDPAIRDLAWLLFSANLLQGQPPVGVLAEPFESSQEALDTVAWLRALDAAPADLQRELAASRITRLGRYAEHLLGYFLRHGPAARLVAAGVQVRSAGRTLGECDFLLRTRQGVQQHWELATKCYLHAGEGRGQLADYVGPNLKDRFDLKLAHVLSHQLPLSASGAFASLGYAGPWAPQMFIKGWLFYRHGNVASDPVELDPAHGRGWWVTCDAWQSFAANHASMWRVLPRLEWLAPRCYATVDSGEAGDAAEASPGFVDAQALGAIIALQRVPVMVAAFVQDTVGRCVEKSRGFVVPDDWPLNAQAYARQ